MFVTTITHGIWILLHLWSPLSSTIKGNAGLVEEHQLPSALAIGQSYNATWTLDIHEASGFARFQVQFPIGIEVEPVQVENASFSFKDGKAKFIWIEIPQQQALQLELKLTAAQDFEGGEIEQQFSFIRNGSRQDVALASHSISLPTENAMASKSDAFKVRRSWSQAESSGEGIMKLVLSGFEPGQFLKITELIKDEYSINPLSDGASAIRDRHKNELIYIWQSAPNTPEIEITYSVDESAKNTISGTYSTVKDLKPVSGSIPAITASEIESIEQASNETELAQVSEKDQGKTTPREAPLKQSSATQSDDEVAFRVQLLATRKSVGRSRVKRIYSFQGDLRSEKHDAWNKYTTGNYSEYQEARNLREDLNVSHDFPGPFVTAYRGEKRITVQEALLITHQNWIP
ncbi:MAG: hypothetical protein O2818_05085 [Bacteroidetes bacterium]|nr:hypothetical protein [Bacteroidota bacterium]MDA1336245.1 hypothetical protein [Bacteroidota bacterium]